MSSLSLLQIVFPCLSWNVNLCSSRFHRLWASTKASLLSIAASCSGGVGDRIIAAVASVDVVITSLCSGQCQLEQASQYIKELSIQVQAALQFQVPVDYLGRPKKLFCRRGQGDDDEDCYDYKFYWGTICVWVVARACLSWYGRRLKSFICPLWSTSTHDLNCSNVASSTLMWW